MIERRIYSVDAGFYANKALNFEVRRWLFVTTAPAGRGSVQVCHNRSRWSRLRLMNDSFAHSIENQFRNAVHVQLLHQIATVGIDSVRAEIQQVRDLFGGF